MDGMGTMHGKQTSQEQDRCRLGPGPWHGKNEGRAQGDPRSGPQRLNKAVGEGESGTPMMAGQVRGWENGAWVPLVLSWASDSRKYDDSSFLRAHHLKAFKRTAFLPQSSHTNCYRGFATF